MRLFELQWEKVYKWEKVQDSTDRVKYHFTNDKGIDYRVKFTPDHCITGITVYDLEFGIINELGGTSIGMSATGDVVGVFSTITDITKDFIKNHSEVEAIGFIGLVNRAQKNPYSRVNFYKNRAELLANRLNMGVLINEFPEKDIAVYLTRNNEIKQLLRRLLGITDK